MFLPLNPTVVSDTSTDSNKQSAYQRPVSIIEERTNNANQSTSTIEEEQTVNKTFLRKQVSDGYLISRGPGPTSLTKQYSSPMIGTRRSRESHSRIQDGTNKTSRKISQTLPRGFSLKKTIGNEEDDSVYGLYGDLLNIRDYECDSTDFGRSCQDNHRSDPELNTIPYRVSTLDRRVTMKSQRPRSLDLSSWSVESRASSHTTSSSDASSDYQQSPSVSRNASFLSNRSSCIGVSDTEYTSYSPEKGSDVTLRRRVSSCRRPTCIPGKDNSKEKADLGQKTVTTLMGGRGYIHWKEAQSEQQKISSMPQINNSDAHVVIWEHRL